MATWTDSSRARASRRWAGTGSPSSNWAAPDPPTPLVASMPPRRPLDGVNCNLAHVEGRMNEIELLTCFGCLRYARLFLVVFA